MSATTTIVLGGGLAALPPRIFCACCCRASCRIVPVDEGENFTPGAALT
ncbi:MAG: hypothetical protein JO166_12720 [Deltaproteobacteria bacterium]|nr:hypothetical protein [Deltaproteobacteria bacterium]